MSIEKKQTGEKTKAMGNKELRKAELSPEKQEKVSGGSVAPGGLAFPVDNCKHPRKYKTGREREDSRFVLWSQHQFEYYCPDCQTNIWVDEEP